MQMRSSVVSLNFGNLSSPAPRNKNIHLFTIALSSHIFNLKQGHAQAIFKSVKMYIRPLSIKTLSN